MDRIADRVSRGLCGARLGYRDDFGLGDVMTNMPRYYIGPVLQDDGRIRFDFFKAYEAALEACRKYEKDIAELYAKQGDSNEPASI